MIRLKILTGCRILKYGSGYDFELFIDFSNTEMLISHEIMIGYGIFFVQ